MTRKESLRAANRRYYQKRRAALIEKLGGVCVYCKRDGIENRTDLEFDHKFGNRTWCMRKLGPLQRLKRIELEADKGEIQILCGRHNGAKHDESDDLGAELRGESTQEPEPMAKEKKQRKPRYGKAYATFGELMRATDGVTDAKTFVLPIVLPVKGGHQAIYARATSYAQAMNAACLMVFGEPRKLTDKEQLEMVRAELSTPQPGV